jgi:hypothetical protein
LQRPKNQRRADYFLYTWQIGAIRRMAQARGCTPSEVVRELLSQALTGREVGQRPAITASQVQ